MGISISFSPSARSYSCRLLSSIVPEPWGPSLSSSSPRPHPPKDFPIPTRLSSSCETSRLYSGGVVVTITDSTSLSPPNPSNSCLPPARALRILVLLIILLVPTLSPLTCSIILSSVFLFRSRAVFTFVFSGLSWCLPQFDHLAQQLFSSFLLQTCPHQDRFSELHHRVPQLLLEIVQCGVVVHFSIKITQEFSPSIRIQGT